MKYYSLSGKDKKVLCIALAPKKRKLGHELISDLEGKNEMPYVFDLVKSERTPTGFVESFDFLGVENIWDDYIANSLAYPMMSERMKTIIEEHLTGEEGIDWIRCNVKGPDEIRHYYVLRFNKPLDVLNMEKTRFVDGANRVMVPCYDPQKIEKYAVFTQPTSYDFWKITPSININEPLKKAMVKAKLIGVKFSEAKVA